MTLVLLDTNTYLRLAKRIRPLLGVKFGQKDYVLTVLKDVEDELRRSPKLRFNHPWFEEPALGAERDARQVRLSDDEKRLFARMAPSVAIVHVDPELPLSLAIKGRELAMLRDRAIAVDDFPQDFAHEAGVQPPLPSTLREAA